MMVLSMEKYVGKLAVVTGAGSGIGKAISEALVKHGVIVAGIDINPEKVSEHAKQLRSKKGKLHAFKCDLTKEEEILEIFKEITKELGAISILVNCAGVVQDTTLIDGNIKAWKLQFDINVHAYNICTREAIASMKGNNLKGHIIHIDSICGHRILDLPQLNVYSATKHAVKALAETLRKEINRNKLPIKITNLSPGIVGNTNILKSGWGEEANDEFFNALESFILPEDIADGAIYALSTPDHVNVAELTILTQGQDY